MGIQDIIALCIVAVACFYVGRTVWRQVCGGGGCDASCSHSGGGRTGLKQTPLVSLEVKEKTQSEDDRPTS